MSVNGAIPLILMVEPSAVAGNVKVVEDITRLFYS